MPMSLNWSKHISQRYNVCGIALRQFFHKCTKMEVKELHFQSSIWYKLGCGCGRVGGITYGCWNTTGCGCGCVGGIRNGWNNGSGHWSSLSERDNWVSPQERGGVSVMAPPNDQQATNIQSNTNANAAFSNVLLIFSSWLMKVQKWTTSNKNHFMGFSLLLEQDFVSICTLWEWPCHRTFIRVGFFFVNLTW